MRVRVILGPVPCQGCRRFVVWAGGKWRNGIPERQKTYHGKIVGGVHRCPAGNPEEIVGKALARQRARRTIAA